MKRFGFLFFVALLVGFAALAHAGFDEGKAAYDRGDYAKAYKEFRVLAEQGDAKAQYYLGFMYCNGFGVPQDFAEAVKWWRKSAEQGNAEAQDSLGEMYSRGEGVPQDFVQAYMWFNLAAAQDFPDAAKDRDKVAREAPEVRYEAMKARLPIDQREFCSTVADYYRNYGQAPNEFKKSALRRARAEAIGKIIPSRSVRGWVGTVSDMETTSDGNGILAVKLLGSSNITVKTWNNGLSDIGSHTLIPCGSSLYDQVADLAKGDEVVFSGRFLSGDMDYIKESSLTEKGSMSSSEFIFTFTSIGKMTDRADEHKPEHAPGIEADSQVINQQAGASKVSIPSPSGQSETDKENQTQTATVLQTSQPPPPTHEPSPTSAPLTSHPNSLKLAETRNDTRRLQLVYSGPMADFFIGGGDIKGNMELFASSGCFKVELHSAYKGQARESMIDNVKRMLSTGEIVASREGGNPDLLGHIITASFFDTGKKSVALSGKQSYMDMNNSPIGTREIQETYQFNLPKYSTLGKVAGAIESMLQSPQAAPSVHPPKQGEPRTKPTAAQIIKELRSRDPSKSVAEKRAAPAQQSKREIIPPDQDAQSVRQDDQAQLAQMETFLQHTLDGLTLS